MSPVGSEGVFIKKYGLISAGREGREEVEGGEGRGKGRGERVRRKSVAKGKEKKGKVGGEGAKGVLFSPLYTLTPYITCCIIKIV